MDDVTKLKEARTALIERVVELSKSKMEEDEIEVIKELLSHLDRIDGLIEKRK